MMQTPGSALVGYAILKANFNAQASSYLDNFFPFVLAAIAESNETEVETPEISARVRDSFGLHIPTLVLPRILKRTTRRGFTERITGNSVRLTSEAMKKLPDLSQEVTQYQARQRELVEHFATYIENAFPKHSKLTTRDLSQSLARFFDIHAVRIVGSSLGDSQPRIDESESELDYIVASYFSHLGRHDQLRFSYVIEAAKGAMLASVLEIDTSTMNEQLQKVTIVLDSPVLMDTLGFHGKESRDAMISVLRMAREQGARLCIFRHSLSELDGILESIEYSLRSPTSRRIHASRGLAHFVSINASPADIALLRANPEDLVSGIGLDILESPDGYLEYGLDENLLEEKIQEKVRYSQEKALVHDVRSISAIHRMRQGARPSTFERCRAVLVTHNDGLARASRDVASSKVPLAMTTEEVASTLWIRRPGLSEDAPRDIVLASAFAGMQPPPTLWRKYLEEINLLENSGEISADNAVILRETSIGRDAFMHETLGSDALSKNISPNDVLSRIREEISSPLNAQVEALKLESFEALIERDETNRKRSLEYSQLVDKEREYVETISRLETESASNLQSIEELKKDRIQRCKTIGARARRRARIATTLAQILLAGVFLATLIPIWHTVTRTENELLAMSTWLIVCTSIAIPLAVFSALLYVRRTSPTWIEKYSKRQLSKSACADLNSSEFC